MARTVARTNVVRTFFALALLVSVVLSCVAAPGSAADFSTTTNASRTTPDSSVGADTGPEAEGAEEENVVVVLTGGLRWTTLDLDNYPNLADLATNGTTANMVPMPLQGVGCPFDSWLAISAGRQVYPSAQTLITCPDPDVNAGYPITFWGQSVQALAIDPSYEIERVIGATPGSFADALEEGGVTTQAVGVGGAYILAPTSGIVPESYVQAPTDNTELAAIVGASAQAHQLTVVDADTHSYSKDLQRESSQRKTENQTRLAQGLAPLPDPNLAPEDETDEAGNPVLEEDEDGVGTDLETPAPEFPEGSTGFEDMVETLETVEYDTEALREKYEESRDAMREKLTDANAARVDAVLGELPQGTKVLVASLVDFGNDRALQVAISGQIGTSDSAAGLGTSATTRQSGVIHLFDVAPSVLDWLGVQAPTDMEGAPIVTEHVAGAGTLADRQEVLSDKSEHATAMLANRGLFLRFLTRAAIGFFVLSTVLFVQPVYRRTLRHEHLRRAWTWAGLTVAAVPVSGLLINLLHWWNTENPSLSLIGGSWLLAGGIALICLNLQRFKNAAPLIVISGLTAAILLVDTATGSHLMADSPMGFNTLTAARFYGLGNEAYALLATGALMVLAFIGIWIRNRGEGQGSGGRRAAWLSGRWWAFGIIGVLGLIVAGIDAMPSMGADFGGALSFLPALIVLMLLVGQIRLSWGKALGIVGITVVGAVGVALLDWMRPASARTHLGRFMESALHGELWEILGRKGGTNIRLLFSSTHRWVVLAALLLVLLVLLQAFRKQAVIDADSGKPIDQDWRPAWWNYIRMSYLSAWGWLAPTPSETGVSVRVRALKPALISIAVCMVLAFALNDSGIVLPGMSSILLVPLLVSLVLGDQEGRELPATKPKEPQPEDIQPADAAEKAPAIPHTNVLSH